MLSASICFLGFLSSNERVTARDEIVKFVHDVQDIKCSPEWLTNDNKINPKVQNKMFKSILKEFGLRHLILRHNFSGIVTEQVICETIFHMLFTPSCPLVIDPTGEVQQFVKDHLLSGVSSKKLYGCDLSINT